MRRWTPPFDFGSVAMSVGEDPLPFPTAPHRFRSLPSGSVAVPPSSSSSLSASSSSSSSS